MFGLLSYGLTAQFDLWTAIHVVGGGLLLAGAVAANVAGVRRSVVARGTLERAQAGMGALLFTALLVAVNIGAARYPFRWDATEQRVHTLADKTRAIVAALDRDVEILVFSPTGEPSREGLREVLDRVASLSSRVRWRFVDAERDPSLADQLGVTRQNVIVARAAEGGLSRQDLDAQGLIREEALARLIAKACRPEPRVVYALTGHGEPSVRDLETPNGLGDLARVLEDENFRVEDLLLSTASEVPADATVVIVAAPSKPLLDHERSALRAFLDRGGRLLALLDLETDADLDAVLADYRIVAGDAMIIDQEEIPFLGARLGLDPIISDFPDHPITKSFRERIVLAQARPIEPAAEGGLAGVEARVVARTGSGAWAEPRWREVLATGKVTPPPEGSFGAVSVAVAATTTEGATRILVVGDSDLARNGRIGSYFNREFLLGAVQWLAGDEELIAEPAKSLRASRLDMTEGDYRTLFRLAVLLLPEALLIVGLAFWWRRRLL